MMLFLLALVMVAAMAAAAVVVAAVLGMVTERVVTEVVGLRDCGGGGIGQL